MVSRYLIALMITLAVAVSVPAAFTQIPPGYYDAAIGLSGPGLKTALHNIIDNHVEYSYSEVKAILMESNEDPGNPDNILLLYTPRSQPKSSFGSGANDWNREHVWAKSHGDFGESPPCGTDVHHMAPEDASVNSDRGNKDFDEGGQPHGEATGCYFDSDSWEPRDAVKGDVARMILYMDVRYEGGSGELNLTAVDAVNTSPDPEHGKLSTLLEWNNADLPDDFEKNRNEVIYSYQQNRNPFIDHPEFADLIWNPTHIGERTAHKPVIFPNPVRDVLTISSAGLPGVHGVFLYNTLGVEMTPSVGNSGTLLTIDLTGFQQGVYILTLFCESGNYTYRIFR